MSNRQPMSIMVVDDDIDLRTTLKDVLEEEGYAVCVAEDGRTALDLLTTGTRPDVILLDMMMPGMNGWSFRVEQLKSPAIASIPIIVFTAYGIREEIAKIEANAYLKKPIRFDELLETIARFHPNRQPVLDLTPRDQTLLTHD